MPDILGLRPGWGNRGHRAGKYYVLLGVSFVETYITGSIRVRT
jgi:hypothetical protein